MQLYLRLAPGEGRRAESIGFARSFDLAKAVEQAKKEEADSKCQERHPRLLETLYYILIMSVPRSNKSEGKKAKHDERLADPGSIGYPAPHETDGIFSDPPRRFLEDPVTSDATLDSASSVLMVRI